MRLAFATHVPPDADEGSNRNDNKRQGYRIPHSKFPYVTYGSFGAGPER